MGEVPAQAGSWHEMATDQETTRAGRRQCPSCGMELSSSVLVCPRDGTQVQRPINSDPAFANYEFLSVIGEGGMGVIYKAHHRHLNKIVAIKTLHSHLTNPELIRRFHIEGKAASILSHPNIITVQDFGLTQSGQPYMIMDFVNGQTLSDGLRQFGQIPMQQFIPIFLQVIDALSHAHKRAVLHRDVKPSNIMIIMNERNVFDVRIMDFGIAKLMNESETGQNLTKTGDAIGSPIYMSPEQARGGKMDHRSDLYSLGCVMYEALTGSPPFCGNTALDTMMMHIETKPLPLSQASMGLKVDRRVEQLIMRLLEKNPDDRYQSMDELRDDMIELQNPDDTKLLPSVQEAQLAQRREEANKKEKFDFSKHIPLISIGCAVLLLGAGSLCFLFWKTQADETTKKAAVSNVILSATGKPTIFERKKNKDSGTYEVGKIDSALPSDLGTASNALKEQVTANGTAISTTGYTDNLTDADLTILKKAKYATRITMRNVGVGDAGLDNLRGLKQLLLLDIGMTKAKTLRFLSDLKQLQYLAVNNLELSPEAFDHISKLTNLMELKISATPVTDSDLAKFKNLTKLRTLTIESCVKLTDLGIDKFKNQQPLCTFVFFAYPQKPQNIAPLIKTARALLKKNNWSEANHQINEALKFITEKSDPDAIVEANIIKGDIQVHYNLMVGAECYYNFALKTLYFSFMDDPRTPIVCEKLASCYESSKDAAGYEQAMNAREKIESYYQKNEKTLVTSGIDETDWHRYRFSNLEQTVTDYLQTHNPKGAARVLHEMIDKCGADDAARKIKYQKQLKSLPKS